MTSKPFTTCLWFDGKAEEAANFYASVFEDAKVGGITRNVEGGAAPAGSVLTVEFELNGQHFVGLNGGPQFEFTEAISFQIHCADQSEVDYYWDKLIEGGEEGPCGWLKDKYGVSWQVIPDVLLERMQDPDQEKASRVLQAMFTMKKIDVAALEKAYEG